MNVARELLKVAKLLLQKTAASSRVYLDVGEDLDDLDLYRLLKRLTIIASLQDTKEARERWTEKQDGTIDRSNDWYKDRKALLLATGFFRDKQNFLPIKLQTIRKRLEDYIGPIMLLVEQGTGCDKKWFNDIVMLAKKFVVSIKKWLASGGEKAIPTNFDVSGFNMVNAAALDEQALQPYIDITKKAATFLPSRYIYGDVRITTSKEMGRKRTIAYYSPSKDMMALLIDRRDDDPVHSFIHEIAHRVWHKFYKEKLAFYELFDEASGKGDIREKDIRDFVLKIPAIHKHKHDRKFMKMVEALLSNEKTSKLFLEKIKKIKNFYEQAANELTDAAKRNGIEPLSNKDMQEFLSRYVSMEQNYPRKFAQFFHDVREVKELRQLLSDFPRKLFRIVEFNEFLQELIDATSVSGGGLFPTPYSRTDVEEFFAENYANYRMGKAVNPKVKELLEGY